MKINIDNFINHSLQERIDLVCNQGTYIGVRKYYGYYINLYLLDDIFFEVFYSPTENKIEKVEILDDKKKLDLYINYMQKLDQIDKERT
jgi:hypothetical protein